MRRLALILTLAAALYAATFWRGPITAPSTEQKVLFTDLMPQLQAEPPQLGAVSLTGAWQLSSANEDFGGYSALGKLADGRLLAVSDRNSFLIFPPPVAGNSAPPVQLRKLFPGDPHKEKQELDAEALTIDPASGEIWMAFEDAKSFWAFAPNLTQRRRIAAPVLLNWPGNAGPEAMTRLSDGRFMVMIEARESELAGSRHPALLYPSAPHPNQAPLRFTVEMPAGFRPTDAAPLPDGRALVLGRDWGIGGFESIIGIADLSGVKAGAIVPVREIARITDHRISDNYEGMLVEPELSGKLTVWLISDNNQSFWLQRNLLLRLSLPLSRLN